MNIYKFYGLIGVTNAICSLLRFILNASWLHDKFLIVVLCFFLNIYKFMVRLIGVTNKCSMFSGTVYTWVSN